MKRVRIGISVGPQHVRLLAVRGQRVLVAATAALGDDLDLEEALGELLRQAPLPRFPRPEAVLALGPSRSQVRALGGLPESRDARLLAEVVRQDAARFFLRNGVPLVTTGVRPMVPGEAWAAALDEAVVRSVQRACEVRGVRLEAAAPSAVALARQLPDGSYLSADGPVIAELEVLDGSLHGFRRRGRTPADADGVPMPGALAGLGEDAQVYVEALAAAQLPAKEPLAVRFAPGDVPRWRVALAGAALAVALAGALVLPVRRTQAAERTAAAQLERMAPAQRAAARETRELLDATAALQEVEAFAVRRRSAVGLVAGLARALPPGSALVSVRADTAGGTLVALAPRAAEVLAEVDRLPGVGGAAITGPVTRESVGTEQLERVSIRFRWRGAR